MSRSRGFKAAIVVVCGVAAVILIAYSSTTASISLLSNDTPAVQQWFQNFDKMLNSRPKVRCSLYLRNLCRITDHRWLEGGAKKETAACVCQLILRWIHRYYSLHSSMKLTSSLTTALLEWVGTRLDQESAPSTAGNVKEKSTANAVSIDVHIDRTQFMD